MNKKPHPLGDFIGAGFKKIDHVKRVPPKIKWGELYGLKTDQEKIKYLEKLAAAMNHAADVIQKERDELNALCEKKEQQLRKMDKSVRQNNEMLQLKKLRGSMHE